MGVDQSVRALSIQVHDRVQETNAELVTAIVEAIVRIETRVDPLDIAAIVTNLPFSAADLRRLARTLRRDVSVLTIGGQSTCVATIEPLIAGIQDVGGRAVTMPRCRACEVNDSATYSRQLRRRICRQCARTRWLPEAVACSSCARVSRPSYRSRAGAPLCRRCPPELNVDHGAHVRAGIVALDTGLDADGIDAVVSAFKANVALRDLNWILHDTPEVFSGGSPHVSARSVRLAELLIARGASGVRTPICPLCARVVPLRAALDGLRCCHRCWQHRHSRGSCERCGQQRHLTNHDGAGPRLCGPCHDRDDSHHRQCTGCGRVAFVAHRRGATMLCRRCYRGPTAICSSCGRERQCDRIKTGKPVCQTCAGKQRTKQPCSRCGNLRLVHLRTDDGHPVCGSCARKREPCARCGHTRAVVARLDIGPLCGRCVETEPTFFVDCTGCGQHRRAYHFGLCNDCACPGVLAKLFGDAGELGPAAARIVAALLQGDSTAVLAWAEETTQRRELAHGIRNLGNTLDHEVLDALAPSKSLEWLRNILIATHVLPDRDRVLHRTEILIKAKLSGIENPDDRATVRAFMEWHHLRKLRKQATRAPLGPGYGAGARSEITTITCFLAHLHRHELSLATCTQHDVDDWLVANPTRPQIHQLLRWSTTRGHARGVAAPIPPDRRTRRTLEAGDAQRWKLIERLIADNELDLQDRVAGLLVLLYSQQTSRLVALRANAIREHENGLCTITLGDTPLQIPEPVASLFRQLAANRQGHAAVEIGINPWLFPGGHTGQHLSAERMGARLRRIGISPQLARNTALIALAGELPAVVMAKLLGFSIKRTVVWNAEAGHTYNGYAAAVARRTPQ